MSQEPKEIKGHRWHELKTHPVFFDPVFLGQKNFEVRVNDRGYRSGDILILKEYDPETEQYTGRQVSRRVTYLLNGGVYGIAADSCVMGLVEV